MNRKIIKCIAVSLATLSCMYTVPQKAIADTISTSIINTLEDSTYMAHKDNEDKKGDKDKKLNIFSEENLKYLSSKEKKQLKELKECKDTGSKLSKEQMENLHGIVDSIIKGKLGDTKYKDFKCLMEKKGSGQELTNEEEKKLKEYQEIIDRSNKLSSKDILKQFLR